MSGVGFMFPYLHIMQIFYRTCPKYHYKMQQHPFLPALVFGEYNIYKRWSGDTDLLSGSNGTDMVIIAVILP